ncbi:MAG: ester cyclase [Rubrivivax sp.]
MKGFDPEFQDLDHYIRVITDRIWEGRRVDDIHRYYGEGCVVETPSAVSVGVQPVIDGTWATLKAFPDRRLLAEDVIVSGDEEGGFLSSHRIFSPMTHAGPGVFGAPSGQPVHVRTIADCVCVGNRIVHEWLVRDQAAIARQIGLSARELADRWLISAGGWSKQVAPPPPGDYRSAVDDSTLAQSYASAFHARWIRSNGADVSALYHTAVIAALPGGERAVGPSALAVFWAGMAQALRGPEPVIEHLTVNVRPGRATPLAMRWRLLARHEGDGRYGRATGRAVEVMGITHAEFEAGRVVREWHLIDDVALWMQVLGGRS